MRERRFCCGVPRRKQKVSPSVSAPLHLILQAPTPAAHEWRQGGGNTHHLCQICHLTLDGQGLRCKDCGLNAHSQCGSSYPSLTGSPADRNPYSSSLGTTTTASIRSSSVPPPRFEPRIKKLLQVSIPTPPPASIESEHSIRLSSASTPILIGGATETETPPPRSESKTPETPRVISGVEDPGSSPDGLQEHSASLLRRIDQHSPEQQPPSHTDTGKLFKQGSGKVQSSTAFVTEVRTLRYVDGPLDGAIYTLVKPKGPSSADSGISVTVDQMKDLDRLLDALVEDAESIPDIPYHAREDSLPFSYGITDQNALRQHPRLQNQPQTYQSQNQQWTPSRQEVSRIPEPQTYVTPSPAHHRIPISPVEKWNQSQRTPDPRPRVHELHFDVSQDLASSRNRDFDGHNYASVRSQPSSTRYTPQEPLRRDIYATPETLSLSRSDYGTRTTTGTEHHPQHRLRSASADGSRSEDADAWLKRQLERLQEKRSAKHSLRNDWLVELKRSLPRDRSEDAQNEVFRPSSAPRLHSRSTVSTPAFYSSDDEDFDTEVETAYESPYGGGGGSRIGRGRKIDRIHSETAYDRMQRTPNLQTYASRSGHGDFQRRTTPGFPSCPPTPYLNRPISPAKPPRSPKSTHRNIQIHTNSNPTTPTSPTTPGVSEWISSTEAAVATPRSQTPLNLNPRPVFLVDSEVKFARDLSSFWYKPNSSREETISALRFQRPGAFIIRNSNSFPGAYGLAVKVDDMRSEEAVRHFLIEPTKYGVRLRGSAVEPVFGSLSALVYAHSIECLALPTTLSLPTSDCVLPSSQSESTTANLLSNGAACQLLFLGLSGVECITGDEAIARGVSGVIGQQAPTVVSLRLSKQGLTITDIYRQRFFRLHFPLAGISYAAVDPERRTLPYGKSVQRIFGVVARTQAAGENSCVVLAELEEGQPAQAIVSFFQRVIAWNQN